VRGIAAIRTERLSPARKEPLSRSTAREITFAVHFFTRQLVATTKETRPTLCERSECVGRPKRDLAALKWGAVVYRPLLLLAGVFHQDLLQALPRAIAYLVKNIQMPNVDSNRSFRLSCFYRLH
jgi:hypothetical protein